MADVSPRAREMLRMRFEEDMTQAEIGAAIGISQMQVSRILRQTIAKLREVADEDVQAEAGEPRAPPDAAPRSRGGASAAAHEHASCRRAAAAPRRRPSACA